MSPILGIWASQISGRLWEPQGAYDALSTVTVPSGGVASITFAAIPSIYKHLQIRAIGRVTAATTDAEAIIRFNGDTGANYSDHYIAGNGSGPIAGGSGSSSAPQTLRFPGASSSSGIFGAGVIDILDYGNTSKNKTVRAFFGQDQNNVATGYVFLRSTGWYNTAAITSIVLTPNSGNFAEYSQFSLYGIK